MLLNSHCNWEYVITMHKLNSHCIWVCVIKMHAFWYMLSTCCLWILSCSVITWCCIIVINYDYSCCVYRWRYMTRILCFCVFYTASHFCYWILTVEELLYRLRSGLLATINIARMRSVSRGGGTTRFRKIRSTPPFLHLYQPEILHTPRGRQFAQILQTYRCAKLAGTARMASQFSHNATCTAKLRTWTKIKINARIIFFVDIRIRSLSVDGN